MERYNDNLIEAGKLDVSWTMQYGMGSCFHCSAGVQSRNDININNGNNNKPSLEQCPRHHLCLISEFIFEG